MISPAGGIWVPIAVIPAKLIPPCRKTKGRDLGPKATPRASGRCHLTLRRLGERRSEHRAVVGEPVVGLLDRPIRNVLDQCSDLVTMSLAEAQAHDADLPELKR